MDTDKITLQDAKKVAYICQTFIEDIGRFTGDYGNIKTDMDAHAIVAMLAPLTNAGYAIAITTKALSATLLYNSDTIFKKEDNG